MSAPSRFYAGRLARLDVFDPLGDRVGRVRDVVVTFRASKKPRVLGLVVEVPGKRRVFVPMTRVTSVEGGQVITTGLVNMRRFEQRPNETLIMAELIERHVTVETEDGVVEATIEDIGVGQARSGNWAIEKAFVRTGPRPTGLAARLGRRRGETFVVAINKVTGLETARDGQSAQRLLEDYEDLKPADLADFLHGLSPQRRAEVAAILADDRLADVLEELPEDDQVQILSTLKGARAADVLEAMEPDDAADLLSELPAEHAERLLGLMEPDEAEDLRRLLTYEEDTAGGLMTTEPIILGPEASVAEALAVVRREEISPAVAAAVFVCRPPLETPTGRYLGLLHIQRLLREPPHASVGDFLDTDVEPVRVDAALGEVTRHLATYNLVSLPVVDANSRLVGVVTVDDVLDHLLPDDWREERHEVTSG